ncbi:MAG: glycosyltransferase family 4 protein [Nitrososphaerales archaeon]
MESNDRQSDAQIRKATRDSLSTSPAYPTGLKHAATEELLGGTLDSAEKRRKIVLVCHSFLPNLGGVESHVYMLARELVKRNFEVVVMTNALTIKRSRFLFPKASTRRKHQENLGGIRVIRCWFFLDFVFCLLNQSRDAYLVHVHGPYVPYPLALSLLRVKMDCFNAIQSVRELFQKPIVCTLHGLHLRFGPELAFLDFLALDSADWVIAVDSEMRNDLIAIGKRNVSYIPNGIDDSQLWRERDNRSLKPSSRTFSIICPRRLDIKNGIEYGILAFKELVSHYVPNSNLVITGPGYGDSYEMHLRDLLAESELSGKARILNGLDHASLMQKISESDLALFPSLWESTSIAAIECLSRGVPVVAFNTGGLRDIVEDGYNGFLVPPKDVSGMASCAAKLLMSGELYAQMSRNARVSSEKFQWSELESHVLRVYSLAVLRRATRP